MSNDPAYDTEKTYWPNQLPVVEGVDPNVSQDPKLFDGEGDDK